MSDKSYNGWTNYETWNVALWIDNEPGTYEESRDMARHARSERDLATALQSWVEDMAPDLGASMFSDLLNAALSEVDWDEIAEHFYEEAHEDDEAEEEAEA
jgi:hypothetical protein